MDQQQLDQLRRLVDTITEQRTSPNENELVAILRQADSTIKLSTVRELLFKNVRLAAAVAARIHLQTSELQALLNEVLKIGKANPIKLMIENVISHQMKASDFVAVLRKNISNSQGGVHLAAYYYLGSDVKNGRVIAELQAIKEATRPSQQ